MLCEARIHHLHDQKYQILKVTRVGARGTSVFKIHLIHFIALASSQVSSISIPVMALLWCFLFPKSLCHNVLTQMQWSCCPRPRLGTSSPCTKTDQIFLFSTIRGALGVNAIIIMHPKIHYHFPLQIQWQIESKVLFMYKYLGGSFITRRFS